MVERIWSSFVVVARHDPVVHVFYLCCLPRRIGKIMYFMGLCGNMIRRTLSNSILYRVSVCVYIVCYNGYRFACILSVISYQLAWCIVCHIYSDTLLCNRTRSNSFCFGKTSSPQK